jgi:hypothetical protein
MKKLKEIRFNHELIGQEGIVIKYRNGYEVSGVYFSKKKLEKKSHPILSISEHGNASWHTIEGIDAYNKQSVVDLIMYQEVEVKEPRVIWVNFFENSIFGIYSTKKGADDFSVKGESYETVKFIEVIEEGE